MANLKCKKITIAVAGTITPAESTVRAVQSVTVINPPYNTGSIYFGGADMSATKRATLAKGDRITLFGIDLSELNLDVSINGESVEVIYYV